MPVGPVGEGGPSRSQCHGATVRSHRSLSQAYQQAGLLGLEKTGMPKASAVLSMLAVKASSRGLDECGKKALSDDQRRAALIAPTGVIHTRHMLSTTSTS